MAERRRDEAPVDEHRGFEENRPDLAPARTWGGEGGAGQYRGGPTARGGPDWHEHETGEDDEASRARDRSPLTSYVHDHLAGAEGALELIGLLRRDQRDEPLARFAGWLEAEVSADRDVLRSIAEELGGGASLLKETAAWLGEKATRLKLGNPSRSPLARLEVLEALSLGVLGKRALWRSLAELAPVEPRLRRLDLHHLATRAEEQHEAVEERRLAAAKGLLRDER